MQLTNEQIYRIHTLLNLSKNLPICVYDNDSAPKICGRHECWITKDGLVITDKHLFNRTEFPSMVHVPCTLYIGLGRGWAERYFI